MRAENGLSDGSHVVDVGSGTGISAELFLRAGCSVTGVEPNAAMRAAAETQLAAFPRFRSVNGSAEATGLPDHCADLVLAAQAFHWFDPEPTKREWLRILKPRGRAAILFNDRDDTTPLGADYERLLERINGDYQAVKRKNMGEQRHRAFLGDYSEHRFANVQRLDFDAFLGRLRSSSYAPKEGAPGFAEMAKGLREIFDRHQGGGFVKLVYRTSLLVGRPGESR